MSSAKTQLKAHYHEHDGAFVLTFKLNGLKQEDITVGLAEKSIAVFKGEEQLADIPLSKTVDLKLLQEKMKMFFKKDSLLVLLPRRGW